MKGFRVDGPAALASALEALPPFAHVLLDWFLFKHKASGTTFDLSLFDTNRGAALELLWSEQVWAWLWAETDPVQFACGWRGGSAIVDYPRACSAFSRQIATFKEHSRVGN